MAIANTFTGFVPDMKDQYAKDKNKRPKVPKPPKFPKLQAMLQVPKPPR